MTSRRIIVKNDAEELNAHAAELFISIATNTIAVRGHFSVSLAGGTTPTKLYSRLSSKRNGAALDWTKVAFFFGDERNVPPESPESNFRMANETLLEPLGISASRIFRWRTESGDANSAAQEYEERLREHFDSSGSGFDLVLLGLGTDGHTASLFPNTLALRERDRLAIANWVDKLNDHRLTLTFPVINRSTNIVFLVSGKDKAPAVAEVLEGDFRPDEFPAQFVVPESGALYWLLDTGAAGNLKNSVQ